MPMLRKSEASVVHPALAGDLQLSVDHAALAALCKAHGIHRLSLFGSVLRSDFDPARSDVDVLVEFEPGRLEASGWNYFDLPAQLAELFGHPVDLLTPRMLSRYYRGQVLAEARPLYEQA